MILHYIGIGKFLHLLRPKCVLLPMIYLIVSINFLPRVVPHEGPIGIPMRLVRSYLNYEITKLLEIINHEWCGHGFRLREFGIKQRYNISVAGYGHLLYIIPFYGIYFGGYAVPKDGTQFLDVKKSMNEKEFLFKETTVHLAGIESADVMRTSATLSALKKEYISSKEAWLYLLASMDKFFYIIRSSENGIYLENTEDLAHNDPMDLWEEGLLNDMNNYMAKTNAIYNNQRAVSERKLKTMTMIEWADPFLYYSLGQVILYLAIGMKHLKYPMIPIWKIGYLPAYKAILTPYGLESQIINYLRYDKYSGRILINFGNALHKKFWGIGIDLNLVPINKYVEIGGSFYFWNQPELYKDPMIKKNKSGALFNVAARYNVIKSLSLDINIGYKSKGYIQGYMLDKSFIVGAGLSYQPLI